MDIEDQQIEQQLQQQSQFDDWFYGPEINGRYTLACEVLKDKIPFVIGMDVLLLAFFYKKPVIRVGIQSVSEDDDLPF